MENQKLFDRQVAHMVATRLHQKEINASIRNAVASQQSRLARVFRSTKDTKVLEEAVRTSVAELYVLVEGGVKDFLSAELEFQRGSLQKSVDGWFRLASPKLADLHRELLTTPITFAQGGTAPAVVESFGSITRGQVNKINRLVAQGLKAGKTEDRIVSELTKAYSLTEQQSRTLVVTSMTRSSELAKRALAEANPEVVSGYVFTAILDAHTTSTCASNSGLFQPLDRVTVRPPLHWNCRSSLVPMLRSREEILANYADSPRLDPEALAALPPGGVDGSLPLNETFEQWLLRQPMEKKVATLGSEERVGLFERGVLRLSQFFERDGKPVSLGELRTLDANAVFRDGGSFAEKSVKVAAPTPARLVQSRDAQKQLRALLLADVVDSKQSLSLTDYRGTTLVGKRATRRRTLNELDERNNSFDPFTGEERSTLYYDPDYSVYTERQDFLRNSKTLSSTQKDWILQFVDELGDEVSTNQKSAILEALRVTFERARRPGSQPWEDFGSVLRAEMNYAVANVSRILDRRSRAGDELFIRFSSPGEEAQVSILGRYYRFADLLKNKLTNRHYVDDWDDTIGRKLARRLYYTGKSPVRAYLFGLRPEAKGPSKVLIKWIEKHIPLVSKVKYGKWKFATTVAQAIQDTIPGVKQALDFKKWWETPSDPLVIQLKQRYSEFVQRVLDLEFLYVKNRNTYVDQVISSLDSDSHNNQVRILQRAMKTIGSGVMTDYDGLAITLGEQLSKSYQPLRFWYKPTLQEFHRDGSRLLDALAEMKLLRVQSRGVVRRATLDLETGRLGGNWKDTVSREVTILDPDLLELQSRNRQLVIADRIGVNDPGLRYTVKAGKKTYFDAQGNDTKIPIITRSAAPFYDENLVDADFAAMLNHTMSTEFKVDPDFSSFFLDLARFRDSRGKADYYDELNLFRHEVIARGEQGFGLLETVKYHLGTGKGFSVHARIDGRGRVYYNGYLTPTGGEVIRPFLNSAETRPMTLGAMGQIRASLGTLVGESLEVLTDAGRIASFERHEKDFLELGALISATTQRERRLREFLEHPLVRATDGEEIAKLARFSLEYYRVWKHTGGDVFNPRKLASYQTALMAEIDASASGLQMIALATGNRQAALTSNVLPTPRKQRIYDLVAQDTVADPRFQKLARNNNLTLSWEDLQKAAKYQVMIALYGAGKAGQVFRVTEELAKVFLKKEISFVTRKEQLALNKLINQHLKEAVRIGATETVDSLTSLQRDLNAAIRSGEELSAEFIAEATEFHPDLARFVQRMTAAKGTPVGPDLFKEVTSLMSEKMAERAPVTQEYIVFWKRVAQTYANETQKVDMPWVTFDGKRLYQRYRTKLQEEIRFRDTITGRYVRNIYQTTSDKDSLLGKGSIGSVRLGAGVNGS